VIAHLFHSIRPLFLLNVILLYMLGIGVARYNGAFINWDLVILGLLWLLALYVGGSFLHTYFNNRSRNISGEGKDLPEEISRPAMLWIAYGSLATLASLSILVIHAVKSPAIILIMFTLVIGALSYSVPPIRIEYSGYGELVLSTLVVNLIPALGYQLQGGDTLRLLAMVTFPLTALHLAALLVFSLSTYAADLKYDRRSLMIRMGWQNGMLLHNLLILFAYLILILSVTFGLPWKVGMPALLTLPIGILQIWMVNRIAAGVKPQWRALKVLAGACFGITVYLLTFNFWIR
jgi:1,4-dihydroxy-2-naphthoate octaprenyltransferase